MSCAIKDNVTLNVSCLFLKTGMTYKTTTTNNNILLRPLVFFLASNGKVSVGWVVLDDYSCISFYDSLRHFGIFSLFFILFL